MLATTVQMFVSFKREAGLSSIHVYWLQQYRCLLASNGKQVSGAYMYVGYNSTDVCFFLNFESG
jgi:hypothetical protein